jgi:mono/diheme cytochrome c family protein
VRGRSVSGAKPKAPLCILAALLLATGCQQQMARQPRYKPLQESTFFRDGRSARTLEAGTVPRGYLRIDRHLYTGREGGDEAGGGREVTEFPFPITEGRMEHGRELYNVFCAVCHDRVGSGRGMIVQRGYLRPPSFHSDRLREAPVGHYFGVITHGHGGMPDYAEQIPPTDRWEIIAYIRALQLSQNSRFADLPADERKQLAPAGKP